MWKNILIGVITTAVLLGATGCKYGPERKAEHVVDIISYKLDLTEPQREKLDIVKDQVLATRQEILKQRMANRSEIEQLILADQVSGDRLWLLYEERRSKAESYMPALLDAISEFHASLTIEQKEQLIERLRKHMKHHQPELSSSEIANLYGNIVAL